jgi:DNA-binding transcriptional ArsR family regulator
VPLPGNRQGINRVAASFRGLAHPTRLRIIEALRGGDAMSPTQLCAALGEPKLRLGNVAHHARTLRDAGLIAPAGSRPVRGAVEHFYRLSPHGIEALELIDRMAASLNARARGSQRGGRAAPALHSRRQSGT